MHRVMRPGGRALVIDLRRDAPSGAIADEVAKMRLGRLDALVTRTILSSLRKRAYTRGDFARLLSVTPFKGAEIDEEPMALEIRLVK
jgi:hypothetical protein